MQPVVTIITVAYHHEKFIGRCVESVIQQTFPQWELIVVVDDATSDRTCNIVRRYKDPRIQLLPHEERYGPHRLSESYNEAFAEAKGDFIAILEGDDFWPLEKLEIQLKSFHDSPCILTYGECQVVREDEKPIIHMKPQDYDKRLDVLENRPVGRIFKEFPHIRLYIYPVTAIIRKEPLSRIGGFQQGKVVGHVDVPTFCRLALEGEFRFIPEILGFWRRHSESTSHKYEMPLAYLNYIQDFVLLHKERLNELGVPIDLNRLKILHQWIVEDAESLSPAYTEGRFFLTIREWKKARTEFFTYLREFRLDHWRDFRRFLASIVGILSSFLKVNLADPLSSIREGAKQQWKNMTERAWRGR